MVTINSSFADLFKKLNELNPEEIANKQLALDKTGYLPNENDKFCLATDKEFSSITHKFMQCTLEYLSHLKCSNESNQSFLELANKVGKSFEFHKALLLKETKFHLLDLLFCKSLDEEYFDIKYLKNTYDTNQLTKIFQNVRALANKLNADIENDFATKVMQVNAPKKEEPAEHLLLRRIQFYEDFALGEKDIEILNPDRQSNSSILSTCIPAAILIGAFAIHMYYHS